MRREVWHLYGTIDGCVANDQTIRADTGLPLKALRLLAMQASIRSQDPQLFIGRRLVKTG